MNIPIDDYIIVCVSQLRREKAHTNLLEAASKLEQRCNLMPQMVLVRDGADQLLARHTSAPESTTPRRFNNQACSFAEFHRGSWPKLLTVIRFVLDAISARLAGLTAFQAKRCDAAMIRKYRCLYRFEKANFSDRAVATMPLSRTARIPPNRK